MGNPLNLPFDPIERAHDNWAARWGKSPAMAAVTSIMRAQQLLLGQLDAVLKPCKLTFAHEALVLSFSSTGALPLGKIGGGSWTSHQCHNTIDLAWEFVRRRPIRDGRSIADHRRQPRGLERTRDLLDMEFGLGCYSDEELWEIYTVFRNCELRRLPR